MKTHFLLGAIVLGFAGSTIIATAEDEKGEETVYEIPPMVLEMPEALPKAEGKYDIPEISEKRFDLEKKVIKLRFYTVKEIDQKGPDVVAAHLFDRASKNCIYVHFPKEGREWLSDVAKDGGRGASYVYILVQPQEWKTEHGIKKGEPRLVAVGRKAGSTEGEYKW